MSAEVKAGIRVAAVESAQVVAVADQKAVDAAKVGERSRQSYAEQLLSQRLAAVAKTVQERV